MRKISLFFSVLIFFMACRPSSHKGLQTQTTEKKDTVLPGLPDVEIPADSGKPYFKIIIYKNSKPEVSFEGDYAIALRDANNISLQLSKSKRLMAIDDYVVLYFNGIAAGDFPIVSSGNEAGKPTLIYTPAKDGAYGIGISADSGMVHINKYDAEKFSGRFDAYGMDTDSNRFVIKAAFVNIKNNNLDQ
jgi:hypothetical protein